MSKKKTFFHQPHALVLASCVSTLAAASVFAGRPADDADLLPWRELIAANEPPAITPALMPSEQSAGAATAPATPSQNVTINLINRLVKRGLLPKEDADDLIKQAEADAVEARAQAAATQTAANQAAAAQSVVAQLAAVQSQPQPQLFPDAQVPPPADDEMRITYIPEVVKAQMREQIKADVMKQAREERWAAPNAVPEWVPRFRVAGDVRVRYEGLFYPNGNDNTGAFPNFNAINTGAPFDVSGTVFSPQYNVDRTRQRIRLRLRIGAEITLGEGFTAGLRIATGENNSPVSTNQTFGASGGDFSKYSIWLDRGFLKYEIGGTPQGNFTVNLGRFDNPFFSTDIIWDDDVGFDGIALAGKYQVVKGLTPFAVAGAFPVFNTDLNFATNQPSKFKSDDKYLYAGQVGTDWKVSKDLSAKVAVAYYHFQNIEGRLSDPYTPLTTADAGNTDSTRPSFAQRGNTYRPLRNIVANANNNFGTTNQFQYFGLATPFRELAVTGRLDYNRFEPVRFTLLGEYVKNLAFDKRDIDLIAVNNRGATSASSSTGAFAGGDTAWMVGLRVGHGALEKRWDWNVGVAYRHVESDAVVDGFTDSDFGGGGTNLEGYIFSGVLALSNRVSLGLRWLSADSIAGPPFKNDIVQFDINGKF